MCNSYGRKKWSHAIQAFGARGKDADPRRGAPRRFATVDDRNDKYNAALV